MILSHTSPKDDAFVYLRGFYNSERNTFIYLLEEMTQKRAFSVDLPSRFHRGAFIVTGGSYRLLQGGQNECENLAGYNCIFLVQEKEVNQIQKIWG